MSSLLSTRRRFLGGALSVPLVISSARAQSGEPIKLGFNGDLSASPSAQSGRAAVVGIQAAIEDLDKKGGVLGRKLSLVIRDDLSQPPKSIQNMSDLIDGEKVAAVFTRPAWIWPPDTVMESTDDPWGRTSRCSQWPGVPFVR